MPGPVATPHPLATLASLSPRGERAGVRGTHRHRNLRDEPLSGAFRKFRVLRQRIVILRRNDEGSLVARRRVRILRRLRMTVTSGGTRDLRDAALSLIQLLESPPPRCPVWIDSPD